MALRGLSEIVGELYRLYPKHVGKRAAERAIENALKRLELELKMSGKPSVGDPLEWLKEQVAAFADSPAGRRGHLTPYPSTWFNQSRYLDDQEVWHELTPEEQRTMRDRPFSPGISNESDRMTEELVARLRREGRLP